MNGSRTLSRLRLSDAAIIAAVLASVFFGLTETVADPDLWGHVRFGSDMLQSGDLLRQDDYSYTSGGQEWINHEWLSELILALTFQVGGEFGLLALKLIVALTLFAALYLHLLERGLSSIRAGLMLLVAYYPLSVGVLTVRPQLFTYLGFLLVMLAMESAAEGRWGWLLGLPVLFAVWVNLHGGFLIGVFVLGVWATVVLFERLRGGVSTRRVPMWALPGCLLASLLATLLNPYGVQLWEFLLRTATAPRPEITEWGPIELLTLDGAAYLVITAVTAIAVIRKPPSKGLWIVYALMAPLPILAVRHLPLFIIAALVISARPLARLWNGAGARNPTTHDQPLWLSSGVWGVAVVMAVLSLGRLEGVVIDKDQQPLPSRAVSTLQASGARGNLAVFFDWGEYAIWHLAPNFPVSWDGRRETVYSEEIHSQNLNFFLGRGDWEELLREHETDLVLTPVGLPVYNLLEEKRPWIVVYEDRFAAVFAREGSSQAERILSTRAPDLPPDGDGLHFP